MYVARIAHTVHPLQYESVLDSLLSEPNAILSTSIRNKQTIHTIHQNTMSVSFDTSEGMSVR